MLPSDAGENANMLLVRIVSDQATTTPAFRLDLFALDHCEQAMLLQRSSGKVYSTGNGLKRYQMLAATKKSLIFCRTKFR